MNDTPPIASESTTYHIVALQELRRHGVAQSHLPVERVFLIVADELHEALEVGRGPQHKVPAIPVDAAMLYLAPGPGGGADHTELATEIPETRQLFCKPR